MDQYNLTEGYIFDIQGFSVHDGPGCRTLIFLKGCPLRCQWCSNPEGIRPFPEPLYKETKCVYDLFCVAACPYSAITVNQGYDTRGNPRPPIPKQAAGNLQGEIEEGQKQQLEFNREKCSICDSYDCVNACLTGALARGGNMISIADLYARIERDRQYWGEKGGITLTGGEPFTQPEFTRGLLNRCYDAFIHTAVETCGDIPWKNIEPSLQWLDWIFFDLKHMDEVQHKQLTSSSNRMILDNAVRLAENFSGRLVFRMPLVPGMNDSDKNISATATFVLSTGRKELNILPVHHLGREKYLLSGQTYRLPTLEMTSRERLVSIQNRFLELGVKCYLGSETPF